MRSKYGSGKSAERVNSPLSTHEDTLVPIPFHGRYGEVYNPSS